MRGFRTAPGTGVSLRQHLKTGESTHVSAVDARIDLNEALAICPTITGDFDFARARWLSYEEIASVIELPRGRWNRGFIGLAIAQESPRPSQ